jgi:uncharacterized spore protein YtfJ
MTTKALPSAAQAPRRRADELIGALADRVGAQYGASTVFGAPVERDGVTVIPVAAVRVGFGGGTGSDPAKGGEGEGAGAGASMTAVGYIELKDGGSRFVPTVRPERMVAMVCVVGLVIVALTRPRVTARRTTRRRFPLLS